MKNGFWAVAFCCAMVTAAQADCVLQLSPPAVAFAPVAHGVLQSTNDANSVSFGVRRLSLNAQCRQIRPMILSFQGPAASVEAYRFGPGALRIRLRSAHLDGHVIEGWRAGNGGLHDAVLRPGERLRPWLDGQPLTGRHLQVEFEIEPTVTRQATGVMDLTRFETFGRFELE